MREKIKISNASKVCFRQRGFDDKGCFGSNCSDACCKKGADFDKETYDLIITHRYLIGPLIGLKV